MNFTKYTRGDKIENRTGKLELWSVIHRTPIMMMMIIIILIIIIICRDFRLICLFRKQHKILRRPQN
jgi:hypothetical protein